MANCRALSPVPTVQVYDAFCFLLPELHSLSGYISCETVFTNYLWRYGTLFPARWLVMYNLNAVLLRPVRVGGHCVFSVHTILNTLVHFVHLIQVGGRVFAGCEFVFCVDRSVDRWAITLRFSDCLNFVRVVGCINSFKFIQFDKYSLTSPIWVSLIQYNSNYKFTLQIIIYINIHKCIILIIIPIEYWQIQRMHIYFI